MIHPPRTLSLVLLTVLVIALTAGCASVATVGPSTSPGAASAAPSGSAEQPSPSTGSEATPQGTPEATPEVTARPTPTQPHVASIDLQVGSYDLTSGSDPDLGGYVDLAVRVKNTGPDAAARRFMVAVTCLGFTQSQVVVGLDGKSKTELQYRFYASVDGDAGLQSTILVDSTTKVKESDEDNNLFELYLVDRGCDRAL